MIRTRTTVARLGALGAAGVIALTFGPGAAHADKIYDLPDHHMVKTLSDGTVVTMDLTGESAAVSPSLGGPRLHRNALVSGVFHVHVDGDIDESSSKIYPGYTVGCQINIAGGGANDESLTYSGGNTNDTELGTAGGGSLSLGPGQAQNLPLVDIEAPDDARNNFTTFTGHDASFTYSDRTIAMTGCVGYAQARAYVKVQIETERVITFVTLYGDPFSLNL